MRVAAIVARRDADTLVNFDVVGPGYVRATGARLLRGREIGPGDQGTSEKVAMVNESFARFFVRDGEALDRHVTFDSASYRIVGVIGDVQGEDVRGERSPRIYFATFQGRTENLPGQFKLLLRTTADPATTRIRDGAFLRHTARSACPRRTKLPRP